MIVRVFWGENTPDFPVHNGGYVMSVIKQVCIQYINIVGNKERKRVFYGVSRFNGVDSSTARHPLIRG